MCRRKEDLAEVIAQSTGRKYEDGMQEVGHIRCSLHIRCTYTAHTLHICCTYAAYTLHICSIYAAHMLHICCSLHICCTYAAYMHICCTYAYTLHIHYTYAAYTLHLHCTGATYITLQVDTSLQRLFSAAAWADKLGGSPYEACDPVGVVGITCPVQWPLLGLISLLGPAIAAGNIILLHH